MKKTNKFNSAFFKNFSESLGAVRNQRGIALLMVLFAIVLLVTLVIEFNYQSRIEFKSTLRFVNSEKAVFLARSGLIAGEEILRSNLTGNYDGLDQFWAKPFPPYPVGEGTVSVNIVDESGKIDINLLSLGKASRSAGEAQIRKLFSLLELEDIEVDEIILWMACENDLYYQGLNPSYTCQKNHALETLSELRLVRGMTDEIYTKISPFLTVYPQNPSPNNPINVNTADPMVLQTITYKDDKGGNYIFDLSKSMAEDLQNARPLKLNTDFDNIPSFKSATKLRTLSQQIAFKSVYFTISSLGEVEGTLRKMVETIFRPSGAGNTKINRNFTRLE
ncbi:MAG: type II secretion system minor pseudopilin GspK [Nitrospiria bacterium]